MECMINKNGYKRFYFDKETGDIVFTPTKCDESGPVAIKVTEWRKDSITRKMEKIGFTRRDIYVTIVTCSDNNPPEIVGVNKHSICEVKRFYYSRNLFQDLLHVQNEISNLHLNLFFLAPLRR